MDADPLRPLKGMRSENTPFFRCLYQRMKGISDLHTVAHPGVAAGSMPLFFLLVRDQNFTLLHLVNCVLFEFAIPFTAFQTGWLL